MLSLPPKSPVSKPLSFHRRGIRLHGDVPADAIGGQTPSQEMQTAGEIAQLQDPVTGGELPQNRVRRYGP